MAGVFTVLLYILIVLFICALIDPRWLARTTRIKRPLNRIHIGIPFAILAIVLISLVSATSPAQPTSLSSSKAAKTQSTAAISNATKPANVVTTKQMTETQPIAFTSTTENDSSLDKGQTKVIQSGVNGVETQVYSVTYTNGNQTSKTLVSQSVTTQPVNEIVADGTYVAPAPTPKPVTPAQPVPSTPSCYPLSDEGTCYEPGEYCRDSDEGTTGVAGDGESIVCEDNDGLRWEPN